MTNEEIKSQSNLEVKSPELYNRQGEVAADGLLSPKLGTVAPGAIHCPVCRQYPNNCLGHEGHLELAYPVINPCFKSLFSKMLSRYCLGCKRLNPFDSLKKTTCEICFQPLKSYHFSSDKPYVLRGPDRQPVAPQTLLPLVTSIPENVLKRDWGYKVRPKDLLIFNLLVTSPSVRPITVIKGVTYTDDLSVKLQTIIEINCRLKTLKEKYDTPEDEVEKLMARNLYLLYELFCYHVYSYIDNKTAGMPVAINNGGKTIKALMTRLEGKEGLFRQNLSAKRTDYIARSVISPSGQISVDSAGVSLSYAKTMSIPALVNSRNVQWYKKILIEDSDYPIIHSIEGKNPVGKNVTYKVTDKNREQIL